MAGRDDAACLMRTARGYALTIIVVRHSRSSPQQAMGGVAQAVSSLGGDDAYAPEVLRGRCVVASRMRSGKTRCASKGVGLFQVGLVLRVECHDRCALVVMTWQRRM